MENQLVTVKASIEADPFINGEASDVTKQAIVVLLKLLQPEPGEVIRSGLHLPFAILLEAYKTNAALKTDINNCSYFPLEVIKPVLNALSNVDQQCCREGLKDLDIMMEKGPSRRCHSSYQHPMGQPLSLRLVKGNYKPGVTPLVDPYDGELLYRCSTVRGLFERYNKNAEPDGVRPAVLAHGGRSAVKTYGKQKLKSMGDYYAALSRETNTLSRRV